jgi:hypothetical protein
MAVQSNSRSKKHAQHAHNHMSVQNTLNLTHLNDYTIPFYIFLRPPLHRVSDYFHHVWYILSVHPLHIEHLLSLYMDDSTVVICGSAATHPQIVLLFTTTDHVHDEATQQKLYDLWQKLNYHDLWSSPIYMICDRNYQTSYWEQP